MHQLAVFGLGLLSLVALVFVPTIPLTALHWVDWWWDGAHQDDKPQYDFGPSWIFGAVVFLAFFFAHLVGSTLYDLIVPHLP
jgi:hypothetical protein